MKIEMDRRITLRIYPERMPDVPAEEIERVISQVILKFSQHESCTRLILANSTGENDLFATFWTEDECVFRMGVFWVPRHREFIFHTVKED